MQLMDPGYNSGLGTGPLMVGGQVFPGHPSAQEFNWMEAGPPGVGLVAGAGIPLANILGNASLPLMAGITKQGQGWINKAKNIFGTTDNIYETGYILPKGELLDFSGKNFGGQGGARELDHRDIWQAMGNSGGGTEGMYKFMKNTDAIRVAPLGKDTLQLHILKEPTPNQMNKMLKGSRWFDNIIVDIDENPRISNQKEFSGRTKASQFREFIEKVFK